MICVSDLFTALSALGCLPVFQIFQVELWDTLFSLIQLFLVDVNWGLIGRAGLTALLGLQDDRLPWQDKR